tara:strand:- start:309 stop:530 length:222 start_codon:yes stop_codon:yes gene_type:complete
MIEFKREFVSENEMTKTYIIREKKYPFLAICVHKETGMEIEQASYTKAHAIRFVEREMEKVLKEGKLKTKEKS